MNQRWLNNLLMFAWLTIGYGAIHAVVSIFGLTMAQGVLQPTTSAEYFQMTSDFEPMIGTWDGHFARWDYRRLDGTKLEYKLGHGPRFLNAAILRPNSDADAVQWQDRICSVNDFEEPAVYWYFVVPPDHAGTGYFTGYDELSRRHIGYINLQGFTMELPAPAQSFPVRIFAHAGSVLTGTLVKAQTSQYQSGVQEPKWSNGWMMPVSLSNATNDSVWIHSNDTIYEIHLASRTVRTLVANRPDILFLYQRIVKKEGRSVIQLIARTVNGVSFIDPKTGEEQKFSFGEGQVSSTEQFYSTHTGFGQLEEDPDRPEHPDHQTTRYAIVTGKHSRPWEKSREVTILWMNGEGNVERQQPVKLLNQSNMFSHADVPMTVCLPVPLISAGAIMLGPVFAPSEFGDSKTYIGRVADCLNYFRLFLPVSFLIGAFTGWACRRREREVFGIASWFWPLLVGACGWFGWIGYICLRPLPARLPNRAWVTATPEPASTLGTEIFG